MSVILKKYSKRQLVNQAKYFQSLMLVLGSIEQSRSKRRSDDYL